MFHLCGLQSSPVFHSFQCILQRPQRTSEAFLLALVHRVENGPFGRLRGLRRLLLRAFWVPVIASELGSFSELIGMCCLHVASRGVGNDACINGMLVEKYERDMQLGARRDSHNTRRTAAKRARKEGTKVTETGPIAFLFRTTRNIHT